MSSRAELMTTEPRVSVEDVARYLGIAQDSVYRRIYGRGLPAYKFAWFWKFKLTELDVWVRGGGADAHEADAEPKPRGKW